eukprot:11126075-Karenia_brevis.AAC.1
MGPVEAKLRSFGDIRGLVFGSWAETSQDVDWLLHEIAALGSRRRPGRANAGDEEDVQLRMLGALRRRWGLAAARANAMLLLDRLRYVGRGAMAADGRRAASFGRHLHCARAPRQGNPMNWP